MFGGKKRSHPSWEWKMMGQKEAFTHHPFFPTLIFRCSGFYGAHPPPQYFSSFYIFPFSCYAVFMFYFLSSHFFYSSSYVSLFLIYHCSLYTRLLVETFSRAFLSLTTPTQIPLCSWKNLAQIHQYQHLEGKASFFPLYTPSDGIYPKQTWRIHRCSHKHYLSILVVQTFSGNFLRSSWWEMI